MKEPDDKTGLTQPDKWNLTTAEIAEMLRRSGVEPWRGSPLARLQDKKESSPETFAIEDAPEIREAVAHIGRPDIILGLLHVPPADPDVSWFYGVAGDRRFAVHRRDGGMWHRIVWPVHDKTLADLMETAVFIDGPAVTDAFALSLDRRGFEALAVIVDFVQEETLRAAMNRTTPSPPQFDIDDLYACYQRNLRGIDLRWMVQRAKLISPVRLAPDPVGLRSGLDSLAGKGMLVREGSICTATPRFASACSLLAACSGFFALSTRRRTVRKDGNVEWDFQHVASLRGVGSLWLLEFSDITASGFTVKLGDVTPSLLHERVLAGLLPPEQPTIVTVSTVPEAGICLRCGAKLPPSARFCSACGAGVATAEAMPKEAPGMGNAAPPAPEVTDIPCPSCGALIASRNKFCTRCGSPLR